MTVPVRIALFYVAVYLVLGLHLPYWPVWLRAQGLDERQIGLLMAMGMFVRVLAVPVVGSFADRLGEKRRPMIVLAALSLAGFAAFYAASGFWVLAGMMLFAMAVYPPLLPMIETINVQAARRGELDFGRTRIWGSLAFVAANVGGGMVLAHLGAPGILVALLVFLAMTLGAAVLLPEDRVAGACAASAVSVKGPGAFSRVTASPLFWLFMLSAGLIQGAHAMYYSFASIHWRGQGLSGDIIGVLWAVGVIAEIVLFYFAARVLGRVSPAALIMIGGFGAVLRWSVMSFDPPLGVLFLAQTLHALSFGAVHIGGIYLIDRAVPQDCAVTAQSAYSALSTGVIVAVLTLISGDLYATYQGAAYAAMAAIALIGTLGMMVLLKIWQGGMLVPERA